MKKIGTFVIIMFIGICVVFGESMDSVRNDRVFSFRNYSIESLSAFGVGGLCTIISINASKDKTFEQMGKNSLIAYSIGGSVGGYSAGLIIRRKFSIKPLLFSTIGSLVGYSTGYLISEKNIKAGEITALILMPVLSGLGVELSYCF